jgi:hypothetical protein
LLALVHMFNSLVVASSIFFLYPNNLKNWEFGKKAPQNFYSEQATIAERQGSSENENSEVKPTQPETNFSSCLGISFTGINPSFGFISSKSREISDETADFSSKGIAEGAISEKKNEQDRGKILDFKRIEPKTQVIKFIPNSDTGNRFPDYIHFLNAILSEDAIEMEDGTQWEVVAADIDVLKSWNWELSDPLVITPNHSRFSSADFYITNKKKDSYIRANLITSPIAFGQLSHWITRIDLYSGHAYLENGTAWCVNNVDDDVFKDWEINDHIVIGYHDASFSPYDRILINFNKNSYVRAKNYEFH